MSEKSCLFDKIFYIFSQMIVYIYTPFLKGRAGNGGIYMSSVVGSMNNVKIFILYLMQNVGYPLDFVSINDMVMQTDYVMYLDFAVAFNELLDAGLVAKIEGGEEELYEVTENGKIVATELKSDVLGVILDKALYAALRYLDFKKRGVTVKFNVEKTEDGRYKIEASFIEKGVCIFSQSLLVDSLERAEQMKKNYYERPEALYKGVLAILSGNVNYLFT